MHSLKVLRHICITQFTCKVHHACMMAAPSGRCLRGEGLVWLIWGAGFCSCSIIGSCQSTATFCDCTARLV